MFQTNMQSRRGFTLIELLVVIAIIGILSAIGLVALSGAREKGRDAQRKHDLSLIANALQLYFDDQPEPGVYPTTAGAAGTATLASTALAGLSPTYISPLPALPQGTTAGAGSMNDYWYRTNGSTQITVGSKVYDADQLFWIGTQLERGGNDFYLLNNLGFAGTIANDPDYDATSEIQSIVCDGDTTASGTLNGCSSAPANN